VRLSEVVPQRGPVTQVAGTERCRVRGGETSDLLQVAHQGVLNPEVILGMRESHGTTATVEGKR